MKFRLLGQDAGRIWRGARRYREEKRCARRIDLGIAYLHAVDPVARQGTAARYRAAVTDLGPVSRPVRLVLDFCLAGALDVERGRSIRLVTDLMTHSRARREVEWHTDGLRVARARCGPEDLACQLEAMPVSGADHDVVLTLLHRDRMIDRVVARQRIEPEPT